MDENLSEKEQIELIRQWWRENGWYLVGGAVLAGLGYFGWGQYQARELRIAEDAGVIYRELVQSVEDDDREQVDALLTRLATDYAASGYTDQARLLIAQDNLVRDTDRSILELEAVVAQSGDAGLANIARERLARVLAYDEQFDRALDVLNVADAGEFEARFSEIRGDIHAAAGNTEAAISAYTDALFGAANGTVDSDFVQLKLNDLIQATVPDSAESGDEG
ncbi:MAG TPA: tetratricopeptide repeat protein [Gammaproteobacteria bacterium]|jgi:predicted negative regulator of RcsB-dependent stress response